MKNPMDDVPWVTPLFRRKKHVGVSENVGFQQPKWRCVVGWIGLRWELYNIILNYITNIDQLDDRFAVGQQTSIISQLHTAGMIFGNPGCTPSATNGMHFSKGRTYASDASSIVNMVNESNPCRRGLSHLYIPSSYSKHVKHVATGLHSLRTS